ncbi:MAG: c-type cytochrome [Sphingomonas sp.]
MSEMARRSLGHRMLLAIIAVLVLLFALSIVTWAWFALNPATIVEPPPGPIAMLSAPIPDGPNADLIRRGRYLTIAGDCVSCHTRAGGHPFEGGLGLKTPFGVIYSPNITSDRDTGIGGWTPDQFFAALHKGVAPGGKYLYPALPYPHFTTIPRGDSDAILAYLKTVPARSYVQPANRLPFPLDIRLGMIAWNALNFSPHAFRPDPSQPLAWNRGAYLVEGLGHCGACHTAKTALGAEQHDRALQGGTLDNWVAPDLTGNPRTGLGKWSGADIVEYLKTGRNAHSNAAGQMAEVVTYSTSMLNDQDLAAIATYLKSLKPSADAASPAPAVAAMRAGGAIYADACTSCHLAAGKGQPRMFPPLAGSAAAQQADPTGVIRLILAGGRTAPTLTHASFQSMPSFAWKLNDQQVADVATFVRNSWGNRAAPVSADQVADLRAKLALRSALGRAPQR